MIIYLGKLIACSGLLYLVYIFLLQRQKLLVFNRFYLLAIIPIALFAPLVQTALPSFIPDFFHFGTDPASVLPETMEPAVAPALVDRQEPIMDTNTSVVLIYLLIAMLLLVKHILNYSKFTSYIGRGSVTSVPSVYTIQGLKTPFSFFRRIYVPHEAFTRGEIDSSIIAHEQAHVNQRHSIDVMAMQFIRVILWFNPFVYLIDKAIRQNHEYLADDAVVQVYERTNYQHLIIQWSMSSPDINALPASNFNFLTTKKRLIMLQKRTTGGKLLLMPALTLLLTTAISLLFSTHVEAQKTTPAKTEKTAPAKPAVAPPAAKQPGAPKAEEMRPKPPKREMAPPMKPKKNAASKKEESAYAPAKIEEVYVESSNANGNAKFQEPMRIKLSGTADMSATTSLNSNVQVNDPNAVVTVKKGTAPSGSAKVTEIRSAEPNTITKVNVRSAGTIVSEAKENNGTQADRIVLKGQPAKENATESDKKNAPVPKEVRIQYRGEIPKNPPLSK
ncbi:MULTISPECIES: M56 family metallopeptidase [Sphingobacterium]|uniref:Peptidase M56 domain-containing protein n=1 Tax=Sphingobacterium athyrii TaxID=2152717 RepID=A0A363NJY3_9SPHI|nr:MULTISPECIES: M56 family metallopeptidase [Sphingobacterium]PUV21092.1 hypothetical protein DCO56_28690 [Sphingobacterium athyrii]QIH32309.1 M56 family metallopeptidase [Sphingobacterium sp. DR205]